jgi:hypothetical protein
MNDTNNITEAHSIRLSALAAGLGLQPSRVVWAAFLTRPSVSDRTELFTGHSSELLQAYYRVPNHSLNAARGYLGLATQQSAGTDQNQ